MSKQNESTGTVHQFPRVQATEVKPPEAWRLKLEVTHGRSTATYFQNADASTPLVRIVDVLTDFAERRGIPLGAAVDDFLAVVAADLLGEVFWLREHDFAEPVGVDHMYGALTVAQAEQKTREARDYAEDMRWGLSGGTAPTYTGLDSPLEAFREHIKEASTGGKSARAQSLYAVSHATANRLWSWGSAVTGQTQATHTGDGRTSEQPSGPTWADVVAVKKDDQGACLSWEHKKALAAEFARRSAMPGVSGVAKAMAEELGISVTAFNGFKRAAAEPGKREKQNQRRAQG